MLYRNISDILEMIEQMQTRFISSVASLTEEQENYRPAPDRWTIAENAEHVSIVHNSILRLTFKLLKQAEADPKPAKDDLQLPPLTMTNEGEIKVGQAKAPQTVVPQGGVRVADSIAKSRQTIDDLLTIKPRLAALDLSEQVWQHQLLGEINLYQWLVLLGEHQERHRRQIEAVKLSTQYPQEG